MSTISKRTLRESEILQLVRAGKTNRVIATEIGISPKTLEFHLANIYLKIGVRTRVMAGVWVLQN